MCIYPREHCSCGVTPKEDSETYRRRRDADLAGMARMGFLRAGHPITEKRKNGEEVVIRRELVNPRRRAINKLRQQVSISPRRLKKLRARLKRERKAEQAFEAKRKDDLVQAPLSDAAVPAGMRRTASGLLVPES